MFNLPHKPTARASPDFTQMLILCSIALIVGLCIPVRGSFVILTQIFIDTFQAGAIHGLRLLLPVVALIIVLSSFAAFQYKKRLWGVIIFLGSIYVYLVTNEYLRERAWSKEDVPQLGATMLFASSAFLVVISLIYIVRPGKRPPQVIWWRPEPRANRLIRIAAVLFGGGIISTQNNLMVLGYILMLMSFAISYYAYKL